MKTTNSKRDWVVVIEGFHADGTATYLGELDRGHRQGVKKLENATRFTRLGALRVVSAITAQDGRGIPEALGRAYATQLTPSEMEGK